MPKTRYAQVGLGDRSMLYTWAITQQYPQNSELVALCDSNPGRLELRRMAAQAARFADVADRGGAHHRESQQQHDPQGRRAEAGEARRQGQRRHRHDSGAQDARRDRSDGESAVAQPPVGGERVPAPGQQVALHVQLLVQPEGGGHGHDRPPEAAGPAVAGQHPPQHGDPGERGRTLDDRDRPGDGVRIASWERQHPATLAVGRDVAS